MRDRPGFGPRLLRDAVRVALVTALAHSVGCGKHADAPASTVPPGQAAPQAQTEAVAPADGRDAEPSPTTAPGAPSAATAPGGGVRAEELAAASTSLELSGTISRPEVQAAVERNVALFDGCLALAPNGGRDFSATITVKATVGRSGAVADATLVGSTAKNAKVDACTVEAFKKIQFPAPQGGGAAVITFPLEFKTEVR